MLLTILILIACAIVAAVAAPFMLKVVPPNPYYGFPTRYIKSRPEHWVAVNLFAGRALVGAAAFIVLMLLFYNGTWLRSGWAQLAIFIVPMAAAVAATFWYERRRA
jgi:hypothetical protein